MAPPAFSVSCVAYTSRALGAWSDSDLQVLERRSRDRNLALGVTGRLLFLDGRFIQVLEGPAQTLHDLYRRICQDDRHGEITLFFDGVLSRRAYPSWSMELLVGRDVPAAAASALLAQTQAGAVATQSHWQAVLKNIRALESSIKGTHLRPQQARAAASVERMIDAAFVVVGREGLEESSMQAIATEAHVSLTTAYRYFSSVDQVVGALVRRFQTRRLAAMAVRLADRGFASVEAVAREIVDAVGDTYLQNDLVPLRVRRMALRDHHRIAYAELWDLALIVQAALTRNGLGSGERARIAMALAGLGAQAKMAALHAPEQLHSPSFRRDLTLVLMAAMDGDDAVVQPG